MCREYEGHISNGLESLQVKSCGKKDDPYSVLLRRNKLPMALLDDAANPNIRKVR